MVFAPILNLVSALKHIISERLEAACKYVSINQELRTTFMLSLLFYIAGI